MTGTHRIATSSTAFTLLELMISIAMALVLILGINQVFKYTVSAAGATQAISDGLKNARSAQSVFYRDFNTIVAVDSPAIIINSSRIFAFRGEPDAKSDADADVATADLDGTGEVAIRPSTYNSRSHRTDIMSFFVRDLVKRNTGGDVAPPASTPTPLVSGLTSNEGWIWYGHLWQPDNTFTTSVTPYSTNSLPGVAPIATNPYNFYATNWIVGRMSMVLKEPSSGLITEYRGSTTAPYYQRYITAPTVTPSAGTINFNWLRPLRITSPANQAEGSTTYQLQESRYDLAGTSISGFRDRLRNFISDASTSGANPNVAWWAQMMGSTTNRFQTQPYLLKPVLPASYAKQVPQFIPNCTQFIVEYAGDFISQDDNGNILGVGCYGYGPSGGGGKVTNVQNPAGTDGKIDFVWVGPVGNRTRQIRWYGMPRDVASPTGSLPDGAIEGYSVTAPVHTPLDMVDVVPLRDVIKQHVEANYNLPAGNICVGASFEKIDAGYNTIPVDLPIRTNYAAANPGTTKDSAPAAGMNRLDTYTAAWGPDDILKPSLIRITLVIDDPNGRIAEGQSFEYVFKVP